MNKYTITFQRPDGTCFDTCFYGYDFQHASESAAVILASSLGETGLLAVSYTRHN